MGSGRQLQQFLGLLLIGRAQPSAAMQAFSGSGCRGERDKCFLQDYGQGHSTVKRPGPRLGVGGLHNADARTSGQSELGITKSFHQATPQST